jgi:hypothetical protein
MFGHYKCVYCDPSELNLPEKCVTSKPTAKILLSTLEIARAVGIPSISVRK